MLSTSHSACELEYRQIHRDNQASHNHTKEGKTFVSANGSASVLPWLRAVLVFIIAASIVLLPAVFATISSASSIGTPLDIIVAIVLVNLATAVFLIRSPNTGTFKKRSSIIVLPLGVR